ncbi:MAG: acetolactate synthase large subunit [Caulobacter sp.]|nr:acetolactate synthase large subunit [Caulobacter sp.]
MNGADALITTLADNGVTACFANPGTSEMQFVAALDREPRMRSVLCLFEGVATGAADGYGRMTGTPACTLLHLGPGYANGAANLHNARRAFTPIVNIIGDHAVDHRQYDAPLNSDIAALAAPNSVWVRSADSADAVGPLAAEAVAASLGAPGGGACLILPADSAWNETNTAGPVIERPRFRVPDPAAVAAVAKALKAAERPVAFFAYPDRPSVLVPDGCATLALSDRATDAAAALEALADLLGAPATGAVEPYAPPAAPVGKLDAWAMGAAIARHMPAGAVISDDAVTAGLPIFTQTRSARAHDWLSLTGGAIGQGIPLAIGAAVACPDRKVLALTGDGAGMYTVQGLWTIAREQLDVTVVVFANHAYRILGIEMGRTGGGEPGPAASRLLDLGDPRIDWMAVAGGLGMPAERVETAEAFDEAMARAMREPGPRFIEAAMR